MNDIGCGCLGILAACFFCMVFVTYSNGTLWTMETWQNVWPFALLTLVVIVIWALYHEFFDK